MSSGADFFLKKALGEDFFQSLEKFELYKPGTRTVIDHEEVKTALQIVPRALMSFLVGHLSGMNAGETKEIKLPLPGKEPLLRVTKHERDVFSGEIEDDTELYRDKKVAEFKYRSLPGVGLIILSTFELYDVENLDKPHDELPPEKMEMVQKLIDDRLALHDLVGKVVDKKLAQRDAIQQLVLAKLSDQVQKPKKEVGMHNRWVEDDPKPAVKVHVNVAPEIKVENKVKIKKVSPLKDFLDGRQKKLKKNEYNVELAKREHVSCPDCGQNIFDGKAFSGCICLGDDMDKKVYFAKSEKGVKVRFGKGWDPENIEMLLEVLRRRRG